MRASTWSFLTWSLKSTSTSVTCPEIWLPTITVEIALSVPVAEIATRMSPRSTGVVRYAPSSALASRCVQYHAAPANSNATTTTAAMRPVLPVALREDAGLRGVLMRSGRGKESRQANAPIRAPLTGACNDVGRCSETQG
jgi:hypothetical protein